MTATIIPWNKSAQINSTEETSYSQLVAPQTFTTISEGVRQRSRGRFSGTGLYETAENIETGPLPVERMYPHVFDEDIKSGQALICIRNAISDAQVAVDAFGEPDLQAVGTRLTQIAVTMGKAHALTDFNKSLGALISFIRRATLAASSVDVSRSALNALLNVLELVAVNPMIDLDEASDLVDKLSDEGWHGEHVLADDLVKALVDSSDLTPEDVQALLFPEPQNIEE